MTVGRKDSPIVYTHDQLMSHAQLTLKRYTQLRRIPEWEDRAAGWQDQCDVGLMSDPCEPKLGLKLLDIHLLHSLEAPPQFAASDSLVGAEAARFPGVFQSIYYNKQAASTIESFKMNSIDSLGDRLRILSANRVPLSDLTVEDFDPSAVVVKTVWEELTPRSLGNGNRASGKELYADNVPLYGHEIQPVPPDNAGFGVLPPLGRWKLSSGELQVNLSKTGSCTYELHNNIKIYSLGCFYYRRITKQQVLQYHSVTSSPDILLDQCKSDVCYLILVGVHIMTRETPNWTWMTYWWTRDRFQGSSMKDKWGLFQPNATINSLDNVANPYIEGVSTGMKTNCMECHRHAVYNPDFGSQRRSSIHATGIPSFEPGSIARNLQSPQCYFENSLQTHFLWTIATHSDNPNNPHNTEDPCHCSPPGPTSAGICP